MKSKSKKANHEKYITLCLSLIEAILFLTVLFLMKECLCYKDYISIYKLYQKKQKQKQNL